MTDAKLSVNITADTANVESGITRVRKGLKQFSTDAEKNAGISARAFNALGKGIDTVTSSVFSFKGAIGLAVGGGGLLALANKSLDTADAIAKTADRLGLTTDELQRYQYAAKLTGVENEQLQTAFIFLNNQLAEGKLPYRDINQALLDLSNRMQSAATGTDRARIATEAFGAKAGARLIPFLMQGQEGIKALGDEAERLGLVLDSKTIRAAENFKDQLEILGETITKNVVQGALSEFAGQSEDISKIYKDPEFAQSMKDVGEGIGAIAKIAIAAAQALGAMASALGTVAGFGKTLAQMPAKAYDVVARSAKTGTPIAQTMQQMRKEESDARKMAGIGDFVSGLEAEQRRQSQQATAGQLVRTKEQITEATKKQKELESELSKIYQETRTPLEEYNAEVERLGELRGKLGDDTYNRAIEKAAEEYKKAEEAAKKLDDTGKELGLTFTSAFEDAVVEGKKLSDVIRGLAQDMLRLLMRKSVTEPLTDAAGGLFSSLLGGFGGGGGAPIAGGVGPSMGGNTFSSIAGFLGFANGGMPPLGRVSVVGERGPELFVPSSKGTIIPNHELGGGGGNSYVFNVGTEVNQRDIARLEAMVQATAGAGVIEKRVLNAQKRGAL